MRIVWVVFMGLVLLATVTIAWYVLLPLAFTFSSTIEDQITLAPALQVLRLVEYIVILWGPIWDGFIIAWMFMESQRVDPTSLTYR